MSWEEEQRRRAWEEYHRAQAAEPAWVRAQREAIARAQWWASLSPEQQRQAWAQHQAAEAEQIRQREAFYAQEAEQAGQQAQARSEAQWTAQAQRRIDLERRYGPQIAERIVTKTIWRGMTVEQLIESLGAPIDTDEKVLKTKVKRTYKYGAKGGNRYMYRIFVEDGVVVGWDEKA